MISYLENSVVKGEIVLVVHKKEFKENINYDIQIQKLLKEGYSAKDVSKIISTLFGTPKNEIYKKITKI